MQGMRESSWPEKGHTHRALRKVLARDGPYAQGSEKGTGLNSLDIGVLAPSSAVPMKTELSINLPELPNQQNHINTMEYF